MTDKPLLTPTNLPHKQILSPIETLQNSSKMKQK